MQMQMQNILVTQVNRNGRHGMRFELSTILMKFALKISVQLWSRRDNSMVPTA